MDYRIILSSTNENFIKAVSRDFNFYDEDFKDDFKRIIGYFNSPAKLIKDIKDCYNKLPEDLELCVYGEQMFNGQFMFCINLNKNKMIYSSLDGIEDGLKVLLIEMLQNDLNNN